MVINQQSSFITKIRETIYQSGVPFEFSPEVIKETSEIESEFKWPFIGKRMDLRGKTALTLGSKEVAFSVERKNDDFILGIHSADVANLFPLGSPLDEAAMKKSRSVVFPEKVHSMLPESVVSGFCSLEEGKECFTVSVFLKISEQGKVKSLKCAESVIKVTANCEPEEVEALLFNIDVSSVGFLRYKYHAVLQQLEDMFLAGAILKMARENRGAEEVDTAVRTFSKKGIRGNVVNVRFEKLSDPERLVREVISTAGMEIAKLFHKLSIPCPYRSRSSMSEEGNKALREFLKTVCIDTSKVEDKNLVSFASDTAHGNRNEELILAKVRDLLPKTQCSLSGGYHCGIASKYYVRFAYPASRYSDLCVQRLIKAYVAYDNDSEIFDEEYMKLCATRAVDSVSQNEPKVKALEKRISDYYAKEYLNNNKNKIFKGTVWNVNGDFTEICLDNSCKGVLDFKTTNKELVPGQRACFKVSEIDFDNETVVFQFVSEESAL